MGVEFVDEQGRFGGRPWHSFEGADFGGYGGGEEERLARCGWWEDGKAGFDVRELAAVSGGEEAVGFVEDYEADAPQAADCVFAGHVDVVG